MSNLLWQMLKTAPLTLGGSLLLVSGAIAAENPSVTLPATAAELNVEAPSAAQLNFAAPTPVEVSSEIAPANNSSTLQQIESYSSEDLDSSLGQSAQGASRFRDVRPTDWAFQALDDLVKRYDCLVGYPDGTFRGNRALSRYEFAAGLNACLNQIERLIASSTAGFATKEDLETLRRLMAEFEAELATLGTRVDNLEARTAFLEDHQFSTTTKLRGEVIFAVADVFTDLDQQFDTNFNRVLDANDKAPGGGNTIFADRVRLNFDTSFTGKDLLRTRLQARNIATFTGLGNASGSPTFNNNTNFTREGRLGFEGDNGNNVEVDDLYYRFPIGKTRFQVWAYSAELNDIFDPINPFNSSGAGAVSRFGRFNPIYYVATLNGQGAAVAADTNITDWLNIAGAYIASEASNPEPGNGLLNGDYSASVQLTLKALDDRLKVGLLYSHAYQDNGLNSGVGTQAAQFITRNSIRPGAPVAVVPVSSNNYGISANFGITDQIFVGGWAGYTAARAINTGDGDIWTWAGYLGINDLGWKGNRLGFIAGREPYLAASDASIGALSTNGLGNRLGNRADADTSFHFEGFYNIKVNNNIQVTPGIIAITNPGAQSLNDTLWIGTIRTTFNF